MKLNQLIVGGVVVVALAAVPAASAARLRACVVRTPTPASYTWNFPKEADHIFADIQTDAVHARYHSEQLQSMVSRADMLGWVSDVNQLDQVRSAVNDMGRKLCRLETIRRVVEPWQRKTIDRLADRITLLGDNTRDALVFGNTHREILWVPAFQKYVNNMYSEAKSLTRTAHHAVEYAKANAQNRAVPAYGNGRSSS